MKFRRVVGWSSALWLSALLAQSQETDEVQQLKKQLQEMQKRLEALEKQQSDVPAVQQTAPTQESKSSPLSVRSGKAFMDIGLVGTFAVGTSSASDIEGGTQLGGHDPNQRGFTVQGVEASFAGAVDPYFRANANITFSVDSGCY